MSPRERTLVLLETAGSVVWFLMDASWMWELEPVALALSVPTLLLNGAAIAWTERKFLPMAVAVTIETWVLMNVLWMTAEMLHVAALLRAAQVASGLGVALMVVALAKSGLRDEVVRVVLRRFRRLRLRAGD